MKLIEKCNCYHGSIINNSVYCTLCYNKLNDEIEDLKRELEILKEDLENKEFFNSFKLI